MKAYNLTWCSVWEATCQVQVVWAAWPLGIPVAFHEQNGIAGLTNKWLAKIATKVMQAFPGAFPNAEVVVTRCVTMCWRCRCRSNVWLDEGPVLCAGSGGSQGARILNRDNAAGCCETG